MQKNQKGFTLTELLAAITIIAILAAVGIPSYLNYTKKTRFAEVVSATTAVKAGVEHCYNTIATFKGCNNDKLGIPPAIKKGKNVVKTMVVKDGKIIVTPNEGKGIKSSDLYILTPNVGNDGMVTWKASGKGAENYATTEAS